MQGQIGPGGRGSGRVRSTVARLGRAVCLTVLLLALSPSLAAASITLGQLAPSPSTGFCGANIDRLQLTVTSGNGYAVPGAGKITSWSTNAGANTGQELTMKVYRKVASPATYEVVGEDDQSLTENALNTFSTTIAVKAGDVLGLDANSVGSAETYCDFPVTGDSYPYLPGDLADGASGSFVNTQLDERLNISAVFVPSNAFDLGHARRYRKRGTATLPASLPGPGRLSTSGKGVKVSTRGAVVAKAAITGPGKARLRVKAVGRKKKTLNRTGKVTVHLRTTYTPTGGAAQTQSTKLRLKKRV